MSELKEIRISDLEVILKDNLVKSGILPQSSKELSRHIKIQGNVEIEGGVFGNTIEILEGDVVFHNAVYANTELHISNTITKPVVFKKAVASADSVAALVTSEKVIFGADINAAIVRCKNCFVAGSIFAKEVYLENCVVLGGVFASKSMVVQNVIIGTCHTPSAELGGVNYLLYPACFSVEPISTLPGTELYNLSLANLGALFKGEKEQENTGKIKMDYQSDKQRTVLVGEDDTTTIVNSYSVSSRVLAADIVDLEKLENHFLIGTASLGTQVLKTYSLTKESGEKSEDLSVENIAEFFFKILNGTIQVQDLSGEISFAELKKNLE